MFNLTNISNEIDYFIEASKLNVVPMLYVVGIFWLIYFIDVLCKHRLKVFGLIPRTGRGLIGIVTSPFIHGDFNHLFLNSLPLFFLGIFGLTYNYYDFIEVTILTIFFSGALLWLFGRRGNHIGASGLITGLFAYLLSAAYSEPTITAIFVAGMALYYFGGILLSLMPSDEGVSWEGHLFGFIGGLISLFLVKYDVVNFIYPMCLKTPSLRSVI